MHRAGELTSVRVPSAAEEAVRDPVRVRAALLADRNRAQQRLTAMLLRHGRVRRSGSCWTQAHEQRIAGQRFEEPALAHYRAGLDTRRAELDAIEADLAPWVGREPLAGRKSKHQVSRSAIIIGADRIASPKAKELNAAPTVPPEQSGNGESLLV